ncbi:MAG: hypothetical protein PF542_05360 [Nanoarchaeota archaeon]|jgi:hypothetical protein|nr:hypothetical protein [Nanoarchaeota archaeon]
MKKLILTIVVFLSINAYSQDGKGIAMAPCDFCDTGICGHCNGIGTIVEDQLVGQTCPLCRGSGRQNKYDEYPKCGRCKGTGLINRQIKKTRVDCPSCSSGRCRRCGGRISISVAVEKSEILSLISRNSAFLNSLDWKRKQVDTFFEFRREGFDPDNLGFSSFMSNGGSDYLQELRSGREVGKKKALDAMSKGFILQKLDYSKASSDFYNEKKTEERKKYSTPRAGMYFRDVLSEIGSEYSLEYLAYGDGYWRKSVSKNKESDFKNNRKPVSKGTKLVFSRDAEQDNIFLIFSFNVRGNNATTLSDFSGVKRSFYAEEEICWGAVIRAASKERLHVAINIVNDMTGKKVHSEYFPLTSSGKYILSGGLPAEKKVPGVYSINVILRDPGKRDILSKSEKFEIYRKQ